MPASDASLKAIQRILRAAHDLEIEDLEYVVGRLRAIIERKEAAAEKAALIQSLGSGGPQ